MNEVHLFGQIKKVWTYDDNLYARISVKRDPGRPKRSPKDGGLYDYVTVVFPAGRHKVNFRPGQHLSVHGWIQSRDFDEPLADFLKRAEGAEDLGLTPKQRRKIVVHRSVNEVVVERWVIKENGQ